MKTDFNFNEQLYLFLAIIHFYITNDIALLSTFKVQIQDMTNMTHTIKTENRQATRISLMSQEKSDTTNINETREEMSQILKCSILAVSYVRDNTMDLTDRLYKNPQDTFCRLN